MCATMGRSDGLNISLVGAIKALVFFKLKLLLLSFDDTVDDLTAICQRNGGQIQ